MVTYEGLRFYVRRNLDSIAGYDVKTLKFGPFQTREILCQNIQEQEAELNKGLTGCNKWISVYGIINDRENMETPKNRCIFADGLAYPVLRGAA